MFAVRRSTTYHYSYDTDPYKWESDQSLINFTFADYENINHWYADTGISNGFMGFYQQQNIWIEPKPETGNEMFVSFYSGWHASECLLYCEKSGILSNSFQRVGISISK